MNGVDFNEDQFGGIQPRVEDRDTSIITKLLIKLGIIKTKKQANILLSIFAVIILATTGYIIYKNFFYLKNSELTQAQIEEIRANQLKKLQHNNIPQ